MSRRGGREEEKLKKRKKGSKNRRNKERTQRQGHIRDTKETHIDKRTRTTGNKSGVCVSRHTKTVK